MKCPKRYVHDWRSCPFAHPTENARRRDPREVRYMPVPCPDYKRGLCLMVRSSPFPVICRQAEPAVTRILCRPQTVCCSSCYQLIVGHVLREKRFACLAAFLMVHGLCVKLCTPNMFSFLGLLCLTDWADIRELWTCCKNQHHMLLIDRIVWDIAKSGTAGAMASAVSLWQYRSPNAVMQCKFDSVIAGRFMHILTWSI